MALPGFDENGDLPVGVHQASLGEVVERFGSVGAVRIAIGIRLKRIHEMALTTGHVRRFVVFGSFITADESPNDVDVFMIMDDAFDPELLSHDTRRLFDHSAAQGQFGASVFWLRQLGCFGGEDAAVKYWQVKRGGGVRGIVEVIEEES